MSELSLRGDADVFGIQCGASDVTSVCEAVAAAEDRLGGMDVLVSAVAANATPNLLVDQTPESLADVLQGLLLAPMLLTRWALPDMYRRGTGSVILVSSDAAKVSTPGETSIGGAMVGIVMFARTAALEAKRHGVRVNVVTPSLVAGTITSERITAGGFSARLFAAAEKQAHLGVAEPADVASLIVFLAGPVVRRITGQAISVNGGISAA